MKIVTILIADLRPDPGNARRHPGRSLEAIKQSLRDYGQQKPIVVDSDGVVIAGNGTLAAARALGWKQIEAVETDLPAEKLKGYAVADNRTGDMSDFDDVILAGILSDPDIGFTGFSEADIAKLTASPEPPAAKSERVKFTADQWFTIRQAVEAMREREGDPEIAPARAIELMAAEYMSGA